MVSITHALTNARSIQDLQSIVERCKFRITFWGRSFVTARGYAGSLVANDFAKRVIEVTASVRLWDEVARDQLRIVSREIHRLNLEREQNKSGASLITRIFIAVRKFLCGNEAISFAFPKEVNSKDAAAKVKRAILADAPVEEVQGVLQRHRNDLLYIDISELFKTAARNGRAQILEGVASFWPISYDDWGQAVVDAIEVRSFPTVQFLAGPKARLLPHTLVNALKAAARVDDERFLQEIIRHRPPSPYERAASLCEALRAAVFGNARLLLQGNPQLAGNDYFNAIELALLANQQGILQQLLELERLPEEFLGKLVKMAKDPGSLRLLLRNGPISVDDRGLAAIAAARRRQPEMLDVLKDRGHFLPEDLREIHRILREDVIHRQQVEAAGIAL